MITICNANGSPKDTPAYREAFRAIGLPISDREMRQVAVHRDPNYGHMSASWHTQIDMTRRASEDLKNSYEDPHVFIDWEYLRYATRPMTSTQFAVRQSLHSIPQRFGIKTGSWGMPFVHSRRHEWTTEGAMRLRDQIEPISDFLLLTMCISRSFFSIADRHRYVSIASHAVRSVSTKGLPVFVSFETFERNGNARADLQPDDAVTIGAAMRAVHDAGGHPMIWTELVNGSYQHQLDALGQIGRSLAEGWGTNDLRVQAAVDPQGTD